MVTFLEVIERKMRFIASDLMCAGYLSIRDASFKACWCHSRCVLYQFSAILCSRFE